MVEKSPLNSSLNLFSVGSGALMITCCPLGRIMLGLPAMKSASGFPMMTPWPVAIEFASVAWMLVRASGSSSGLLGDELQNCCPSAAVAGMAGFRTREAATVFVLYLLPPPMMTVASGTTALTPGVWQPSGLYTRIAARSRVLLASRCGRRRVLAHDASQTSELAGTGHHGPGRACSRARAALGWWADPSRGSANHDPPEGPGPSLRDDPPRWDPHRFRSPPPRSVGGIVRGARSELLRAGSA